MRLIRGVNDLVDYLDSINCRISSATIYRLVKQDLIPYKRPAPGIIIFDLNSIDKWLMAEDIENV